MQKKKCDFFCAMSLLKYFRIVVYSFAPEKPHYLFLLSI